MLFRILKKILKKVFTIKKILAYIVIGLISFGGYEVYSFFAERALIKRASQSCEYLAKTNFEEFNKGLGLGLTADNIDMGDPNITKEKNLRILDYDHLKVGSQMTRFTCYYNVATEKAIDRTESLPNQ